MKRKLFTVLASASAVLCIAVGVLCVRSYWVSDSWERDVRGGGVGRVGIGSGRGRVTWFRLSSPSSTGVTFSRPPGYHAVKLDSGTVITGPAAWSFAGFRWSNVQFALGPSTRPSPTIRMQDFTVPDWALVLATGALPGLWLLARWRQRRRSLVGCCRACGYDLRATPDRCPECGAVPAGRGAA